MQRNRLVIVAEELPGNHNEPPHWEATWHYRDNEDEGFHGTADAPELAELLQTICDDFHGPTEEPPSSCSRCSKPDVVAYGAFGLPYCLSCRTYQHEVTDKPRPPIA